MRLNFDETKATQTAAQFLKLAGGRLNYMALIKLLYKADREALRRLGLPITTDTYASLKFGPVTSKIYDQIKSSANPNARPTYWSTHIRTDQSSPVVTLEADPGDSELSRAEATLIAEIFAVDGGKDRFDLADECHRDFPEWKDPGETSFPLEISEIIAALGLTEDEVAHVEAAIDRQRSALDLVA